MFNFKDFSHLAILDPFINQVIQSIKPGIILIAGMDALPALSERNIYLQSSGRGLYFDALTQEILKANPDKTAVLITQSKALSWLPKSLSSRVKVQHTTSTNAYMRYIYNAADLNPELLIIDRMDADTAPAIFTAADLRIPILTQMDTILWGAEIARELSRLDFPSEQRAWLNWIITIHRLPSLCPECKISVDVSSDWVENLCSSRPKLAEWIQAGTKRFYQPRGCALCKGTGRKGQVAVFDIYQTHHLNPNEFLPSSLLSHEEYMFHLAVQGQLALDDLLFIESDQIRHTYNLLSTSQRTLTETHANLNRKIYELESANQVLLKRTEALISLQDTVHILTTSTNLADLAARVCRRAKELCNADNAILYYLRPSMQNELKSEVLAVAGWTDDLLHLQYDANLIIDPGLKDEPIPLDVSLGNGLPHKYKAEMMKFKAGLRVPLVAQGERIGVMHIYTQQKNKYTPGEISLLQTFANQAALGIQRAGLVDELRANITQLESAQKELVGKERMERELELAREVQQSVLPRTFPELTGYAFAAYNEPARQVGGDFYDVILLDEQHFGILIADVSDKGLPAAIYMAQTRSLIRAEARRSSSPSVVLSNVNRLLLELEHSNQFVSVFYGVMNMASRELTYVRAGHDRPLFTHQGEILPLHGNGTVLGVIETEKLDISEEKITLQPGDRLVLYTDGLTDIMGPGEEFFGLEQLIQLLENTSHLPLSKVCQKVFTEAKAYQRGEEQFDDMTMLVLEVR